MYSFFIRSAQFFPWLFLIRKGTCSTETNILEHEDSSSQWHDWLLFSVDEFHYLNAARVGFSTADSDFDCTIKCRRNSFCLSINLAVSKDANGKLWCELLSSDRYRNSIDYRENKTSHHLFLLAMKNRFIYQRNMTPSWLEAHASYIDRYRSRTTEQLTFNAGSPANAAILKVHIMPPDILEDSSLATLKIVASLDEDIGKSEDSDPRFGVSDGVSFVGFEMVDQQTLLAAPCFGIEGTSGNSLGGIREISLASPKPKDTFYDGQFVITLKLNERWGSCYTAHDGGFVKTADYNKRLLLSKGLTLEVYKGGQAEKFGIKFIKVTVMSHS